MITWGSIPLRASNYKQTLIIKTLSIMSLIDILSNYNEEDLVLSKPDNNTKYINQTRIKEKHEFLLEYGENWEEETLFIDDKMDCLYGLYLKAEHAEEIQKNGLIYINFKIDYGIENLEITNIRMINLKMLNL